MHSICCKSVHNWWINQNCAGIYAARKPTWVQTKNTEQKLSKKGLEEERKQHQKLFIQFRDILLHLEYWIRPMKFSLYSLSIKKYKIFAQGLDLWNWSSKLFSSFSLIFSQVYEEWITLSQQRWNYIQ